MDIKWLLDVLNPIAIFQLLFFIGFLYHKGSKIPSTFILKIHLIVQVIPYLNYLYYLHFTTLQPLLAISVPCWFLWAPTFYFYIRSRVFRDFALAPRMLLHAIPAWVMMIYMGWLLFIDQADQLMIKEQTNSIYYLVHIQLITYNIISLLLIQDYKKRISNYTTANEQRKISWLQLITYGITFTSIADIFLHILPGSSGQGWGYILFWVFINLFFFKAILSPDQFLGLDAKTSAPIKLALNKSKEHFLLLEQTIRSNNLHLDPDLSLEEVARSVGLPERVVSQVIRQNTVQNFSDYINSKRICYAKDVLRDRKQNDKTILEILYESGFNSKSVFNAQFKKQTGYTPKEYRKMIQHLDQLEDSALTA